MKKIIFGLLISGASLLPLACNGIDSGTSLPPIGPVPLLAPPTRTFTATATVTKTPINTPTPALTTTCAFVPVTQWGSLGAGNGMFNGPADAAADAVTDIYILDTVNKRVQIFDAGGNYLNQWNGANTFAVPLNMALNQSLARVYVLDTTATVPAQGVVRVFDTDGTPRPPWTVPLNSFGLALDAQGRVYVGSQSFVIRYDQNGFSPVYYYSQGVSGVSFNGIQGVAADTAGNVFVAVSSSVQKFNSSGQYISQWGSAGTAPSQFTGIDYVRTDAAGNVFTLDNPVIGGIHYGRVQKFDTNGSLICYYQAAGSQYEGLAFDPAGELFVVDGLNNRVLKFIP